jgi:hypothetical protein
MRPFLREIAVLCQSSPASKLLRSSYSIRFQKHIVAVEFKKFPLQFGKSADVDPPEVHWGECAPEGVWRQKKMMNAEG